MSTVLSKKPQFRTYQEDTEASEHGYSVKKGIADKAGRRPRGRCGGSFHDAFEVATVVERANDGR